MAGGGWFELLGCFGVFFLLMPFSGFCVPRFRSGPERSIFFG